MKQNLRFAVSLAESRNWHRLECVQFVTSREINWHAHTGSSRPAYNRERYLLGSGMPICVVLRMDWSADLAKCYCKYTVLFDSASDVFSLISPQDSELRIFLRPFSFAYIPKVRRALVEAPENIVTLIRVITSRLFNLVSDHTFPSAPTKYVTSFASSLMNGGATERNTTKEVLNCLRVLQRVLPVIFELESEPSVFEREVLWKRDVVEGQAPREQSEQTPQFVIEDEDNDYDNELQCYHRGDAVATACRRGPNIDKQLAAENHFTLHSIPHSLRHGRTDEELEATARKGQTTVCSSA